ncbi:MAG: MBL fold metallo-hydrolase [Prevotella sp.]|nr:MBL fold metallo-hydrolase [Prevotella sp.]
MKIKFLGTGTSTGVPEIGCKCEVCTSDDKRDRRLRASVLLTVENKRILIDCGPDFRQQIIGEKFAPLNGVLLTHEHYDHVGGLDDLRSFCKFDEVDIYANDITLNALQIRIPYPFKTHKYPGVPSFRLHKVNEGEVFYIDNIEIQPIKLMHYKLSILGYRIGKFAYLTDVKYIPEETYKKLENLDTLVINALRIKEHISHFNLEEALTEVKKIAPKKTYFIHMSHHIGLHEEVQKKLPENIYLSYDGLEIEV